MRKILLTLSMLIFLAGYCYANTVQINSIVITNDSTINVDCSDIKDDGAGNGTMRFRCKYEDNTFTEWSQVTQFNQNAPVDISANLNIPFRIQGQFCDAVGNCQIDAEMPITDNLIIFDNKAPIGTIHITISSQ